LSSAARSSVHKHLLQSRDVVDAALADEKFIDTIVRIAKLVEDCLRAGGKVMFAGNGGSAADAQHIAGEFVCRLNFDRAPIAGLALTTDTSVLTAIGNDYGYDQIFSRQVRGLGRRGDVFVGISTSGRSPNILAAIAAAREMDIHAVGFTGTPGAGLAEACDITLRAPSPATPLIQQIHITAAHAICELVENALFGEQRKT
jgi:D-sedoheptulose 7-phosphate isomerase